MRPLIVPGLMAFLLIAPVYAQSPDAATTPASVAAALPAPVGKAATAVSTAATQVSKEVADVTATFDKVYADTAKGASPVTRIMATAAGAGLGFLASSYIMTTAVAPLAATALGNVGLSEATTAIVTSSLTTLGLVWGTYAGGVYANDLVTTK